jgi:ribosomal protein S6-L-glutamate ligase RimK-like protein
MIAIHNSKQGFHPRWIAYCQTNNIPYKLVNCYSNNIINDLNGCSSLMWHHSHSLPKDLVFARSLMNSLAQFGINIFPDFNTAWHFNDKVGQKYLLELADTDFAPTWIYYDKQEAMAWLGQADFPLVHKLRGGAGSQNVRLVRNKKQAKRIVKKAFGHGFSNYSATRNLIDRIKKYRAGKTTLLDVIKGGIRLIYQPKFSKVLGREINYVMFQKYFPDNTFDTRVIVIDQKAFAIKRLVRKGDFRASGSGYILYNKAEIDERCVQLALNINTKLDAQCLAYDFVFDQDNRPALIEISYGFSSTAYDECPGYWDKNMNWIEGKFNPFGWMVDSVLS